MPATSYWAHTITACQVRKVSFSQTVTHCGSFPIIWVAQVDLMNTKVHHLGFKTFTMSTCWITETVISLRLKIDGICAPRFWDFCDLMYFASWRPSFHKWRKSDFRRESLTIPMWASCYFVSLETMGQKVGATGWQLDYFWYPKTPMLWGCSHQPGFASTAGHSDGFLSHFWKLGTLAVLDTQVSLDM